MSYPCPPCCPGDIELDCDQCNFGRPIPTVEVDLGVGGWIDGNCNHCDLTAGQFTATQSLGRCLWVYTNPTLGDCGGGTNNGGLTVIAQLVTDTPFVPPWRWQVEVNLGPTGFIQSRAVYLSSSGSTSFDCFALGGDGVTDKSTLTKSTEFHSGSPDACSGTLPATIDLWATT